MSEFIAPGILDWLASGTIIIRILISLLALVVLWEVATLLALLIGFISSQGGSQGGPHPNR